MRIFRHWVRAEKSAVIEGEAYCGVVYGGSNASEEEALEDVERRWERVCARIRGQEMAVDEYESDIREEVLGVVAEGAVVTRNRYGAEILNTTELVIVDIDRVPCGLEGLTIFRFLKRLFGRAVEDEDPLERLVRRIGGMLEKGHPVLRGGRVYRTPAGFRCLLATRVKDPRAAEVQRLMVELGVDLLYASLCRKQGCYRARLTAKPSRVPMRSLMQKWPVTEEALAVRVKWVAEYRRKSAGMSACRYVLTVGEEPDSPLVKWHDEASGALAGGTLG